MPGRRNERGSDEGKRTETHISQPCGEPEHLFSGSSLLQELLLDLGLTDTAKTLEEETRRRMQLFATASHGKDDGTSDHGESHSLSRNKNDGNASCGPNRANISMRPSGINNNRNGSGGNGCPTTAVVNEDNVPGLTPEVRPTDTANINLFRSLAHRNGSRGSGGESTNLSALHDICRMSISPLGLALGRSAATEDNDNDDEASALTPLLQKLLRVLLGDENSTSENGEGKGKIQKPITLPSAWSSLTDVLFAYVEVLWAQLRLVEAVSCAEFAAQGWLHHRHNILKRLSLLQEKLQRLLLDAHQLEYSTTNAGRHATSHNNTTESPDSRINVGNSSSQASCVKGGLPTATEIKCGAFSMFCRGAPTFRKNIEEVSTWIMKRCGRCVQINDADYPSNRRDTEPIASTKDDETSSAEHHEEVYGNSSRDSWKRFLFVVRQTALTRSEDLSSLNPNESGSLPLPDPKLRWAQTVLRIQLLGWIVGSVAEFADLLQHQHRHQPCNSKERCEHEEARNSNSERGELGRSSSVVSVVLGFWYQNCAAQIYERIVASTGKRSGSPARHHCVFEDNESYRRRLPRPRRTEAAEEEQAIGQTLLSALKQAAHELLAGTPTEMEPHQIFVLGDDLLHDTVAGPISSNWTQKGKLTRSIVNESSDVLISLLGALATGKPSQVTLSSRPPSVRLHRLIKKALRRPKILLELQDDTLPLDYQLMAMDNLAARMLLCKKNEKPGAPKGLPGRRRSEINSSVRALNEPFTVHTYEGETCVSGEAAAAVPRQQRGLPESASIGFDPPTAMGEFDEPTGGILPDLQELMRFVVLSATESISAEDPTVTGLDEDASSADVNYDRPGDEVLNEVQVVAVTPCGSLLAMLTTKGRLVVFALRAACAIDGAAVGEQQQESFCEQRILDTVLLKGQKESHWYEHIASFLAFSPCGRFLLCSVQNAPPSVPEGEEANRTIHETTGKVFIYSLHCTKNRGYTEVLSQSKNRKSSSSIGCGEDERLYAVFRIHSSPITIARWLDPRFWRRKKSMCARQSTEDNYGWRQEANRRLAELQCLSSGTDNLILRWSPADGSIIQTIATLPVRDILVSSLMQAFYTINHYGQLSMYDAWNENNIGSVKDNTVRIAQRGLPTSLSTIQSSTDSREEGSSNKTTAPLADGEMQNDFFVGPRIIRFDRRYMTQGGAQREPIVTQMSRVVQEKGLPAGIETRDGDRLGRRILEHVLFEGGDHFTPHTQAVLELSSASDDDYNDNGSDDAARLGRRRHSHMRLDTDAQTNPISFLRLRYPRCERNASATSASLGDDSFSGEAILYQTGSRLVFDEVAQALCHTACIWPYTKDSRYAPSPQPYHLLSMAASGYPVWNEEDDAGSSICHVCHTNERRETPSSSPPACSYYSDALKHRAERGAAPSVSSNNNNIKSGIAPPGVGRARGSQSVRCTCRPPRKNAVLQPTASNGRYLCIMASVGPYRAVVQYDQPLEYRAGIYACVVFDVLYGSVLRVIPVCATLPRAALTENGIALSHSHTKRAPIFTLPCSVTVVRRSQQGSGGMGESATTINKTQPEEDEEEEEIEKNDNDAVVLVAVGALHSTVHVFNALTGSSVKEIDLRRQKISSATHPTAEERPPSKRARCSYVSLGVLDTTTTCSTSENEIDADGRRKRDDFESSDVSSVTLSPASEDFHGNQRMALIWQLAEKHGISTVLQSSAAMLRVVPLPFSPFCSKLLREGSMWRPSKKQSGCGGQRQLSGGCCSAVNAASASRSTLLPCPSFIGQMQLAAGGADHTDDFPSRASRRDSDTAARAAASLCYDEPFAVISHSKMRRAMSGEANKEPDTRATAASVETVLEAGVNASPGLATAHHNSARFRCGVVNSVALCCDRVKGGIYVFSGDEYGGFFIAGGLLSPLV
ncbi:mitochondrial ATP-dependent zinc metallopeptidase [Trypanosoma grayi]|uniref:mitochondrial ATP-dependent zinc metallopeptidase n=1 Tax=Trypanosoma grayi TaxID=71804 RepID=UPI0004F49383|nr:mitochondrial ATP-dependent zinc metallopeptidase [Trypanosoma grayi]KEG15170.1 mitochondrial ATP-dependent zinc metallopeptidase [Trypanosoma grayi]